MLFRSVIAGDFNTPLTEMDRSSRHMVNKETRTLNDTLDPMDLTNIFRTLHPKATEYIFSRVHMKHSPRWITYWVTKQPSINIKELRCILSDHNAMKVEINHRKKFGKPPKAWRLKNTLLTNEWVNQAIREDIKKYMETNEMKIQQSKRFGMQQRQS